MLDHLLVPKIHLTYNPQTEDASEIKLIIIDAALDLSQKANSKA